MLSTSLNTEMPLHTGALGGKYFYTETILQRESFRRRHVYTGAFTQICFYTQLFLRTNTFTQCCRVQVLLRRDCFIRKYFYTDIL